MLTAVGVALFTVVTFEIFYQVNTMQSGGNADPIRIIEAVTAGVSEAKVRATPTYEKANLHDREEAQRIHNQYEAPLYLKEHGAISL
jgi:hypothetical protein